MLPAEQRGQLQTEAASLYAKHETQGVSGGSLPLPEDKTPPAGLKVDADLVISYVPPVDPE